AGDRSWSELSRLDAGAWHSRTYAGEPLPTLGAIASFVRHNRFMLNIEIKPTPGHEARTGEVVARHVQRLWAGEAQPLLSSFRPEALAAAQATAPELPRALLLDSLWPNWIEFARRLDCVAVITNHRLMDAELCRQVHEAGWRALCYTVNDAADAERLLALQVDGLITDAVDRFSPAG
ncbi:MAG: glycerophosphodiester phosphodiesterase, partial [Aquabacterium sp.]|nr:glycerophosphodiester phosphodiesterase [Aquabacterium sp.]